MEDLMGFLIVIMVFAAVFYCGAKVWEALKSIDTVIPPPPRSRIQSAVPRLSREHVAGGLLLAGLFGGTKLLSEVLEDVDWERIRSQLGAVVFETLASYVDAGGNATRLSRAELLLLRGDRVSVASAAFLTSATLEKGLKDLVDAHGIEIALQERGMISLARALRSDKVISGNDYLAIRHFTERVRNPAMHGDFDLIDRKDVEEEIEFARNLLGGHRLLTVPRR
jgi:HEPN domain-containing protein